MLVRPFGRLRKKKTKIVPSDHRKKEAEAIDCRVRISAPSERGLLATNERKRTCEVSGKEDEGIIRNLHFCRDAVGNIARLKATTPACSGTPAEQYVYDALYRLSRVEDGSGALVEGYSYNPTGDRLSKTQGGATQVYSYASPFTSHRLLDVDGDSRDYDATGNQVAALSDSQRWTYDERNRLVDYHRRTPGLGADVAYDYNGRGERVMKGGTYSGHFVYDEAGTLLSDAGGGNPNPTAYVYVDGRPVALVRNGTLYYVHSDHLGTPRAVTAAAGATPLWEWPLLGNPFGEQVPAALLAVNLRFPGQYYDAESGLHYNYFRDYEPATGRYVESDPIGLKGGVSTYVYVKNNAFRFNDPTGLSANSTIQCDGNGEYEVVNTRIYCDRICTQMHEMQHISDWKRRYGSGSCRDKVKGYLPLGGVGYDDFRKRSECMAHAVGMLCRKALSNDKQCNCILATSNDEDMMREYECSNYGF